MRLLRVLALAAIAIPCITGQSSAQMGMMRRGVTLFDQERFAGQSRHFNAAVRHLSANLNDRASSVVVLTGRWQFCEHADFRGHCIVLGPGRYPQVKARGLGNNITSFRPVR